MSRGSPRSVRRKPVQIDTVCTGISREKKPTRSPARQRHSVALCSVREWRLCLRRVWRLPRARAGAGPGGRAAETSFLSCEMCGGRMIFLRNRNRTLCAHSYL